MAYFLFLQSRICPRSNSLVLMHDYERVYYHGVEEYYDIVAREERLVILRAKNNLSLDSLSAYLQFIDDPR